ncbi:MAG: tetratricopeptide repeat protein [Bacteroidales bacterium]|nr:tetratricopeptide repeat protein [Bacteroidales bacterium]
MMRGYDSVAIEPDSLLVQLDSAQQVGDSAVILSILYDLAFIYNEAEKYDSASIYYNRGMRIADSLNDKSRLSEMQSKLGNIHLFWGNYRKAMDLYLESLKICNEINDSAGISRSLNNIGVIYDTWGEKNISLKYYEKSYEVDGLLRDTLGQSKTLNNIATLYDELGMREKAINYYFQALELAQLAKDHKMIATASGNIGGYYLEDQDFEKAAEYYFKTVEEYKLARSPSGQAESYINIGNLYRETEEYEAALDYYKQGLDIVLRMNLTTPILDAYLGIYEVYKAKKDYKTALEYFSLWHHLQDSIFTVETSSELVALTSAYETQQKENEMEIQNTRMREQKTKIRRQQIILITLVSFMILIAIFTILLMRQYQLRMRAWRQLLSQHEEILKSRQELIKAKEKAEESDRLKTTFLVNISHELRTPMNGIMGFTDLLQKGNVTEEQSKLYLSYIASSSRQLLKVLNDIIDISSIETGQMKLDFDICQPHQIFEDLLAFFEKEKKESNKESLVFQYKAPEDAEKHFCKGDKRRISQVIFNLLSNAMIFTREGRVDFGYEIIDGKTMKIFVQDTGIGIERSNFEMIFERFRQVDDSTTRQHGGSGLGLAISKELVSLMEGTIYLVSDIGKGSTFYVELPYHPAVVE